MEVLREAGIEQIDVVVASVGAEVYYGPECIPDKGWASHLRAKWRPDRVHQALDSLPFLCLQTGDHAQREFKISYNLDEAVDPAEALPIIHDALTKAKAAYNLVFSWDVRRHPRAASVQGEGDPPPLGQVEHPPEADRHRRRLRQRPGHAHGADGGDRRRQPFH